MDAMDSAEIREALVRKLGLKAEAARYGLSEALVRKIGLIDQEDFAEALRKAAETSRAVKEEFEFEF